MATLAGCGDGSTILPDASIGDSPLVRDAADNADSVISTDGGGPATTDQRASADAGSTTGDAGCAGWTTLKRMSPAEAADLIANSDPIVINVHYPYEGDIPGTDATIPYDDVSAIEAYLKYDHCADVLLVCRSGSMSGNASSALIERGYLRVRDLKGGMIAWQAAGYPLLMDGGT